MAGKNDKPDVREVEVEDMDTLLGTKASTVVTSEEGQNKKHIFSSGGPDTSVLDDEKQEEEEQEEESDEGGDPNEDSDENDNGGDKSNGDTSVLDDEEEEDDEDEDEGDSSKKNKGGRKPALIESMNKLVENKVINLFEDKENIEDYTNDEIVELITANIEHKVNEVAQKAPMDFFSKLDPKLQEVVAYNLNGGGDITSVLKNVTRSQEISKLDPNDEKDGERIAREWLTETKFGTPDEIEEEISAYIDRGELDKKANQFKPKLDKKQAEIMERRLADQNEKKKQAAEIKSKYAEKVFKTLNKSDLNGLPLDNKVQTDLYYGITDTSQYQDREGSPTNELGHLIEEYQLNPEANMGVLLEALWLLRNPQGYRDNVQSIAKQKAAKDIHRELKTAEGKRKTPSQQQGEQRGAPANRNTIKRKKGGSRSIFSRNE